MLDDLRCEAKRGEERCKRAGTPRFIEQPKPYALAGMQKKMSGSIYLICDECWSVIKDEVKSV